MGGAAESGPVNFDSDRVVREVSIVIPDSKEESVSGILKWQPDSDLCVGPITPPVCHLLKLTRFGPIVRIYH